MRTVHGLLLFTIPPSLISEIKALVYFYSDYVFKIEPLFENA